MRYVHTQGTASTSWTVQHNLNTLKPVIDVFVNHNSTLEKILPQRIEVINENTITVTFSTAFTGEARVAS
jgi:hypothetical protein